MQIYVQKLNIAIKSSNICIVFSNRRIMNERVKLIRKALGMTQDQLSQRLGIGKAALSMIETGKAALSSRNRNILVQELNVNPDWLETGQGEMFNAEPDLTSYLHRTDNSLPLQSVPLYSIEGTAGLVPLFSDQRQHKPINYIHIPNLPKCDGAIYVVGDSMYPLLKSGDIVLYKQLHDIGDVFWGDMYLLSIDIDGEEYVTVKYIQKSDREGYVKLVSQNPHHADKEVEIKRLGNYYRDQNFLFAQEDGSPMHPDSVNTWLDRFSKRHGLPHINPHAFRHSMASLLFYKGMDSVSVSARLGHAQVSTTSNIYAHVMEQADKKSADILADVFDKKAEDPSS